MNDRKATSSETDAQAHICAPWLSVAFRGAIVMAIIALIAPAARGAADVPGQPAAPAVSMSDPLQPGRLYLQAVPGGVIETAMLEDARALDTFDATKRYIVQLDGPITRERRAALEAVGVELGEYIPAFAYLTNLTNIAPHVLAEVEFVHWVGHWRDEWKIEPHLAQQAIIPITPERQHLIAAGQTPITITLFAGAERDDVLKALGDADAIVHFTDSLAGNTIISATIRSDRLANLAKIPAVQFIEHAPEITPRNNNVRWVVQSNQTSVTPLYDHNLRGQGQIAGILDTAVDANHCSFQDSNPVGPNHRKIIAYNTSFGAASHGTHVAGTTVGDAGAFSNTRGVAYLGRLVYNTWPSFTESAILQRFNLHHSQGARLHTNSWGDDGTTAYNSLCRGIDSFQWENEDSQTVWAVTNMSALKNPENAKNTLAVGATSPPPSQNNHCTGGTGPTSDGRRKPEIYAPGCSTMSSTPGSCNTGSMSGTSMASPAIAGTGMLVRQYYMDGFYPTGVADPANGFTPSGALIKATLLNSAVDMTGVAGYPSNSEGWGRALADDALHFLGDERSLIVFDVPNAEGLHTGSFDQHEVTVTGSQEKLKVTLVWTEPPASSGTSFACVNDLDLVVTGPNGSFKGNVFAGGVSATGGSKDDRNNVEQVHVPSPGPGAWSIEVVAAGVNQFSQGYALVVTGEVATEEPPLTVFVPAPGAPTLIEPGAAAQFDVHIKAGQEQIVPGSETLHYRAAGGPFITLPLTHVEGDLYRATLPVVACADAPEFYLSAEGDGGTIRTSPANAPAGVYTAAVGVIEESEVLYESFTGGAPTGWTLGGFWHVTNSCAVPDPCSAANWAYYGRSQTCNYVGPGGGANSGQMSSAPIALPEVPPGGTISLEFCYNLETESSQSYDIPRFGINPGSGIGWTNLSDSTSWTTYASNLTDHAGKTITLHWDFNTGDGAYNDYHGWQVDDLRIVAAGLVCEDPEPSVPGDLDGDGSVGVPDLMLLLSSWGACGECQYCPADLDGDCTVSVPDLIEQLSNWG